MGESASFTWESGGWRCPADTGRQWAWELGWFLELHPAPTSDTGPIQGKASPHW